MNKIVNIVFVCLVVFSVFSGAYADSINSTTINTILPDSGVIYVSTQGNDSNSGLTPETSKKTIQNAIDSVTENGTVQITNGVYHEHLKINKSISLMGSGKSVVLDGDYKDSCVVIEENCSVFLEKLIIEKGMNTGLINYGTAHLTNVIIQKNAGEDNGGIHNTGTMTLTNSQIRENSVRSYTAGICNNGVLNIVKSEIKDNRASKDLGGIYNNGTMTVTDSQIHNNKVNANCGGIYSNRNLTITNSKINENDGFGILNYGNCHITGSEINKNKADGIDSTGTLNITNSQMNNNKVQGVANGGLLTIDNSKIERNKGTGVWSGGNASITNSKIQKNGDSGLCSHGWGHMNVTNSIIIFNHGTYGGGIHNHGILVVVKCVIESNTADVAGGGISDWHGHATINDSSICGNRVTESIPWNLCRKFVNLFKDGDVNCKDGGGIYHAFAGLLEVNNCTIADNSAMRKGGGIYAESSTMTVNHCVIRQNMAVKGGGIYLQHLKDSDIKLFFTDVKYNCAVKGGGVYGKTMINYDLTSKIEHNWFKNFH